MLSSRLKGNSIAGWTARGVAVVALLFGLAICTPSYADALLNDSWSDGSRTETDLPNESAVYASHPDGVTMAVGSLTYDQTVSSSQRLATYFTDAGSPQSIEVGNRLCVTVDFSPETALYPSTSRNFRMGIFHDPDDERVAADGFNDSGGSIWGNALGYAVQMPISLSSTPPSPFNIVKRLDNGASTSLLGSNSAYFQTSSGGDPVTGVLNKDYRIVAELLRKATNQMNVRFSLYDIDNINSPVLLSTHTVIDTATTFDGEAELSGIYSDFDLLAFRFSDAAGTADDLRFSNYKVEYKSIPEPVSALLLVLGGLGMLAWRRRS
jgi:hypothetical protein